MVIRVAVISILLLLPVYSGAARDCADLLSGKRKFESYVEELFKKRVLDREDLAAFVRVLNEGDVVNPITQDVLAKNWEAEIHRTRLDEKLIGNHLTAKGLLPWAQELLSDARYDGERRTLTREDTREILLEKYFPSINVIEIQGGTFLMGSPHEEEGRHSDENQVEVELSPFAITDIPITQEIWFKLMGNNPSFHNRPIDCDNHRKVGSVSLCPDLPVERVSLKDVRQFLEELNRMLGIREAKREWRLPTEAQWEYAARAGTTTVYSSGDDPEKLRDYGVFDAEQTAPVRSKRPNPWGLYDVHGNVWEWTMDFYAMTLPGGKDPLQVERKGYGHIVRGGNWENTAEYLRSAYRLDFRDGPSRNIGFRMVRPQ